MYVCRYSFCANVLINIFSVECFSHLPLISYHHQYTAHSAMNKRPISNVCIENSHKLSFAFLHGLRTPNESFFIEIPSGQFDTKWVTSLPGYWGDNLGEACRGQFGGQFEKYRHKNSPLHSFLEQSF